MRLQEYRQISGGLLGALPSHIKASEPKLLILYITGKPADAAGFAEISAPTNPLAAAAAVAIETISGSANDNQSATGHVQSMQTIGINSDDEIIARQELMHATDGTTFLLGTQTYKELFHIFADAHGTGDADAAGQIDIRKIDDTVLVSIPAGKNESNGTRFKIPDGCVGMLFGGELRRLTSSGVWPNDEGIKIRLVFIDAIDGESGQAAADRHYNWIEFVIAGQYGNQSLKIPKGKMFTSGTWISFEHSSIVDAGEDYTLEINFLIWKK